MSRTTLLGRAIAALVLLASLGLGATPASALDPPTIVPGLATLLEGDAGTRVALVPVSLSAPSATPVTVQWATIHGPGIDPPAPAEPGTDFDAASGTVQFDAGVVEATVAVTVHGDELTEPDEWIIVAFDEPTGATIGGYYGLGAAVIEDDDAPPVIQPGVASLTEGDAGTQTLSIPVTLSEQTDETVTVQWRVRVGPDVRPPAPAMPGEDFAVGPGTLTFAPGATEATIPVTTFGDEVVEPDEWIVLQLTDPTHATLGGYWGLAFGVIQDDDALPVITTTGPATPAGVPEGDEGTVTLTVPVRLSRPSTDVVTVDFATLPFDFTDPPTATEGVDYEATAGTVVFAPGVTEASMSVTIIGDSVDERDEYVLVGLRNPTNAVFGTSPLNGIGFGLILDDDVP